MGVLLLTGLFLILCNCPYTSQLLQLARYEPPHTAGLGGRPFTTFSCWVISSIIYTWITVCTIGYCVTVLLTSVALRRFSYYIVEVSLWFLILVETLAGIYLCYSRLVLDRWKKVSLLFCFPRDFSWLISLLFSPSFWSMKRSAVVVLLFMLEYIQRYVFWIQYFVVDLLCHLWIW